jgi:peptide deformylase
MNHLQLIYAPHPIFKQKALPIDKVDDEIRVLIDKMLKTLYVEGAVGIGANMVGLLKRIAVVDLQEDGVRNPRVFINPKITWYSEEKQTFKESSVCFLGIEAEVTRPRAIGMSYLDYDGNNQELEAEGFLATVIQHEVDYLDGKVFLDHLSKLKRDTLMKKMEKYIKMHPPHIHGTHCHH